MAEIIMLDKIPREYKYKFFDAGAFAKCYLTKDGRVLKVFFADISNYENNIIKVSNLESDNIIFPSILFTNSDNHLIGYVSDYVIGNRLDNLNGNTNMESFINALKELELELKRLSKERLSVSDIKGENSFYTPKQHIKLIDIDFYRFDTINDLNSIYRENMSELYSLIRHDILRINPHRFKSKQICDMDELISRGLMSDADYLYEIKREIERTYGYRVRTYDEFNNGLRLIIKKF